MEKETLEEAAERVIKAIEGMDKPKAEILELMINLKHYLNPEKYEENNKVLNKTIKRL